MDRESPTRLRVRWFLVGVPLRVYYLRPLERFFTFYDVSITEKEDVVVDTGVDSKIYGETTR